MGWKLPLRSAPESDDLGPRPVHEVIRDYPEALVALRRAGVDVAAEGGRCVGELRSADEAIAAILAATAWRPDPPGTPPDGTVQDAGSQAVAESRPVPPTPGGP